MRRIIYFLVLIVLFPISIFAVQVDVYVATSGSDIISSGSESNPYRTLKYAVSKAFPGQTVGLANGVYYEEIIDVPPGVSITSVSQDAGKVTIYPKSTYGSGAPFINFKSDTLSSVGNQSLSYVTVDGTVVGGGYACRGILVQNRNDVRIHHCTIKNFINGDYSGGIFVKSTKIPVANSYWWEFWPADTGLLGNDSNIDAGVTEPWPTNPVERFELDYCDIIRCGKGSNNGADTANRGDGCLNLFNVKDSEIHNNDFDNSLEDVHCIRGWAGCTAFLWNVDVYNNIMKMKQWPERASFIIETWVHRGGCEFYDNEFNGGLSITVGKETEIRNNVIIADPYIRDTWGRPPSTNTLAIEFTHQSYSNASGNYIEGFTNAGISSGSPASYRRNVIYDTVIANNICVATTRSGISVEADGSGTRLDGVKIYNNTIDSKGYIKFNGIQLSAEDNGILANVEAVNNIVIGVGGYGGKTTTSEGGTYSSIRMSNNLFYNNGYNSWSGDSSVTGTLVQDPKFVSKIGSEGYQLQSDSPARNAGTPVSLSHDFGGYWSATPSMGAWWGDTLLVLIPPPPPPPINVQVEKES